MMLSKILKALKSEEVKKLRNSVDRDNNIRGGEPVIKGTRFTVSQLLAELADGRSLPAICEDLSLDKKKAEDVLYNASEVLTTIFNENF